MMILQENILPLVTRLNTRLNNKEEKQYEKTNVVSIAVPLHGADDGAGGVCSR